MNPKYQAFDRPVSAAVLTVKRQIQVPHFTISKNPARLYKIV
jgi:hypothetical protein